MQLTTAADEGHWRTAAIALLSVRITQGFIYWGGGSRRFIYAPAKLDPHAASWMANKFRRVAAFCTISKQRLVITANPASESI